MSSQSEDKIKNNHERRLQILMEQAALQGINTPPEVLMEIEDIKVKLGKSVWPWAIGHDVPCLEFSQSLNPVPELGMLSGGILLTDKEEGGDEPSTLYIAISFKASRFFRPDVPQDEKWLYIEANMRPAFNLRIQVQVYEPGVEEIMKFLREDGEGWQLFGALPIIAERLYKSEDILDLHARDQFLVWREENERRMMISTFTATNAGMSIHARLSDDNAKVLADYLEKVGFTE